MSSSVNLSSLPSVDPRRPETEVQKEIAKERSLFWNSFFDKVSMRTGEACFIYGTLPTYVTYGYYYN